MFELFTQITFRGAVFLIVCSNAGEAWFNIGDMKKKKNLYNKQAKPFRPDQIVNCICNEQFIKMFPLKNSSEHLFSYDIAMRHLDMVSLLESS